MNPMKYSKILYESQVNTPTSLRWANSQAFSFQYYVSFRYTPVIYVFFHRL